MESSMTDQELIRAIREDIAAELFAANQYEAHANETSNVTARQILKSVANEEMIHAGEFINLLRALSRNDAESIAQGVKETKDELKDLILHSVPEMENLGGIVINKEEAESGACTCYDKVCFHKGIIGALNAEERSRYCRTVHEGHSEAMMHRIAHWNKAIQICQAVIKPIAKGERLEPWLGCMTKELKNA